MDNLHTARTPTNTAIVCADVCTHFTRSHVQDVGQTQLRVDEMPKVPDTLAVWVECALHNRTQHVRELVEATCSPCVLEDAPEPPTAAAAHVVDEKTKECRSPHNSKKLHILGWLACAFALLTCRVWSYPLPLVNSQTACDLPAL